MQKAIILLSGGLDSTTCLAKAKSENRACYALSINYSQRHSVELEHAKKIADHFGVIEHKVVDLSGLGVLLDSVLTDKKRDVSPYDASDDSIPPTYVPARNTVFLSVALGWAEVLNAEELYVGVSAIDYSGYPDCRPEYIDAFQKLATLATKTGVEGNPINIVTPLLHLSKAQTIQLGLSLGVDYGMTVSCYQATEDGLACGQCESCHYRMAGFQEVGVADPTQYIHNI